MWGLKMSEYKYPGLIKLREGCGHFLEDCGYWDNHADECNRNNYCPECQREIEIAESIEKEIDKEMNELKSNYNSFDDFDDFDRAQAIILKKLKAFIQKGERE